MKPSEFKTVQARFLQASEIDFDKMADLDDEKQQTSFSPIDWRVNFNPALN